VSDFPTSLKTPTQKDKIKERLRAMKSREQLIRDTAGWLSKKEAKELRQALAVFSQVDEEDWR
jgi:hypothetical protein